LRVFSPGDLQGAWRYLYRVVDKQGQTRGRAAYGAPGQKRHHTVADEGSEPGCPAATALRTA